MTSPFASRSAKRRATVFSGSPPKRSRKCALHATWKPALAAFSGAIFTPLLAKVSTQPPSLPSRGQLAPPRASTVTSAATAWPLTSGRPLPSQPCHSARVCSLTPCVSSRASQARSRGEAFIALGKTRPLDPAKVSASRPSAQARKALGGKASRAGLSCVAFLP